MLVASLVPVYRWVGHSSIVLRVFSSPQKCGHRWTGFVDIPLGNKQLIPFFFQDLHTTNIFLINLYSYRTVFVSQSRSTFGLKSAFEDGFRDSDQKFVER